MTKNPQKLMSLYSIFTHAWYNVTPLPSIQTDVLGNKRSKLVEISRKANQLHQFSTSTRQAEWIFFIEKTEQEKSTNSETELADVPHKF